MASVNKVILIGHLGADPESRHLPSGDAMCNLRLATSEKWKDKASGERRESAEWHRVILFRGLAEIAERYLKKGAQIYIEGRLRTRKWQDKNGQDRYTTEIEATEMRMLGSVASVEETAIKSPGTGEEKTAEASSRDPWDAPGASKPVSLENDPFPF